MSEDFTDENIAMLDRQVSELLGDATALGEVIARAAQARMLGLAEAAIYKAVHGDFVSSPSAAGRRFFSDDDHNAWRDTAPDARAARLAALVAVELQHLIKENCHGQALPDDG